MSFIVDAHDDFLDGSCSAKEFRDAILGGVEREVADIDCGAGLEGLAVVLEGVVVFAVEVGVLWLEVLVQL